MKVSELVARKVAFCGLEANLGQAVELVSKNACGCLPVIGDEGNVTGVITGHDISVALGKRDQRASEVHVSDVMTLRLPCRAEDWRRINQHAKIFADSVGHDLQGPLRTIAMSAQLLKRKCGNRFQPDEAGLLTRISTVAERMMALLRDLAEYSEAATCAEGPVPAIDSARVLADVLEILSASIEAAGAIVTSDSLPFVSMHEPRLTRVFQNLISNAIKYASGVPRIHVSATVQEDWCIFSVADNGVGIDPQFSLQIFEPLKRLHSRDQYPGSGLGLAICQRIVEQYGGRIWLETSTPGEGSTFCFAIPSAPSIGRAIGRPDQLSEHKYEVLAMPDSLGE